MRYSIDGKILTDIADAIRAKAPIVYGEAIYEINRSNVIHSAMETYIYPIPGASSILVKDVSWGVETSKTHVIYIQPTNDSAYAKADNTYRYLNGALPSGDLVYEGYEYIAFIVGSGETGVNYHFSATVIGLDENGEVLVNKPISMDTIYTPGEMAEAIMDLSGEVEALEITSNGTYTAPDGIDGYSPITVNVPQEGAPTAEELTLTGDCTYRFAQNGWNWLIEKYGNMITTKDITKCANMFYFAGNLTNIPFDINCKSGSSCELQRMFNSASRLQAIPKIINCQPSDMGNMFDSAAIITEIPEEVYNTWDWSYIENLTSGYGGKMSSLFYGCSSLRRLPMGMLEHGNPVANYNYSIYYDSAKSCLNLDEIIDLPNPHYNATWTSNAFRDMFYYNFRLKNMTFKKPNGVPYVVKWKSQTIDLSGVGWATAVYQITNYSKYTGITIDKEVKDDATYQALKNDPDWFTADMAYSRYNHDSAVATINSLPDTSAYLASAGGTNTIKFRGAAGSATDGGAINTLTESEIAVAAAKGWTVTLV